MNRDSKGRIQSNVVLGRKFCRICGHWKHVCYFPPRRNRNGRVYTHSECEPCRSRLSKHDRKVMTGWRLERRRACERKASLRYLQRIRERDPNYIVWKNGHGQFISTKFVEYLNPQLVRGLQNAQSLFVNGKRLSESEVRTLYRWKSGEAKTIRFGTVDTWAARFDLPLWEFEERSIKKKKVGKMMG